MKRLLVCLSVVLCSCAGSTLGERPVAFLTEEPDRPYEEIALLESRGAPGESAADVYEDLKEKARRLGADAVLRVREEQKLRRLPVPAGGDGSLGEPRPDALEVFRPGAIPADTPRMPLVGGRYWEVSAVAIRYLDAAGR